MSLKVSLMFSRATFQRTLRQVYQTSRRTPIFRDWFPLERVRIREPLEQVADYLSLQAVSTGILSLITSPVALAAIVPAAVFATTKYIGDKVGQTGVIDNPNRQGRPLDDDQSRRRRGETQSSYERRLQANADAEANEAQRQTFFDTYDPRAPFLRSIQDSGVFTGNSGVFAENALNLTEIDVFGRVDLPGLITDLEGILQTRVEGLGEDMERAAAIVRKRNRC